MSITCRTVYLIFGLLLLPALALANWDESSSFAPHNESNSSNGGNDSAPVTYGDLNTPNLNSACVFCAGSGYVGNGSDQDNFQFRVVAADVVGCNKILKITFTSPSDKDYQFQVYADNGFGTWKSNGGGGLTNHVSTTYYDLSNMGATQDFYVQVKGYNGDNSSSEAYGIAISLVPAGTLSGTVDAVGSAPGADLSNFQVFAYDANSVYLGQGQTDSGGAFSVTIPAGVNVPRLKVMRSWYAGTPAVLGYGSTNVPLSPAVNVGSCGSSSGHNIQAFQEAVLSGTYAGTSNGYQNWQVSFKDVYDHGNSGGGDNYYQSDTTVAAGNFAFHNLAPGTYRLVVNPNDGTDVPLSIDNLVLSEGHNTVQALNFNTGGSLTLSFNPPVSNSKIELYETHFDSHNSVASQNNISGGVDAVTFSGLPVGHYTVKAGNGGPGIYFPLAGITVSAGSTAHATVQGLNIDSSLQGGFDNSAIGQPYSNVFVSAIIHGTDVTNNGAPITFGGIANDGTFSIGVDSSYASWDVAVLAPPNNGFPPFYASLTNVAAGATGLSMTGSLGHIVQGALSFKGQSVTTLPVLQDMLNSGILVFLTGGFRNGGNIDSNAGTFSTWGVDPGTYSLVYHNNFTLPVNQAFSIGSSDLTGQSIDLQPDPALDSFVPFADHLSPGHLSQITATQPAISCRLQDAGVLATGVVAPSIGSIQVDGGSVALSGFGQSTVNGVTSLSVSPSAALSLGTHTVVVSFVDNAGNPGSATWSFDVVPAASPTSTQTANGTFTATPTPSVTVTVTQTVPGTYTDTATVSLTRSPSFTRTKTSTPTISATPSASPSVSPSFTASPAVTDTPSPSVSPTATETPAQTATSTATATATLVIAWDEATSFGANNESNVSVSGNSTTPGMNTGYPAAGIADLNSSVGSPYGIGQGYLATSNDRDVFQFRVNAADRVGCNQVLRIRAVPNSQDNLEVNLSAWQGSQWNNGSSMSGYGEPAYLYYDLSNMGATQDFYLQVYPRDNGSTSNPYTVEIALVPGATLSGTLDPVGVGISGKSGIQVKARGAGNLDLAYGNTDASGAYTLTVPVGVTISALVAQRSWYPTAALDWAYGTRTFNPSGTLVANSGCQSLSGNDFQVFREGVLTGTMTGVTATNNLGISLTDPYKASSNGGGGGNYNVSFSGVTGYAMHNLEPGDYFFGAGYQNNGNTLPFQTGMVTITDGFTTPQDLVKGAGATLSGNLSPAGSNLKVKVYVAGKPFVQTFQLGEQQNVSSSYSISGLPAGPVDVRVEASGPASYLPIKGVVLGAGGSYNADFNAPATDSTVSGSIFDSTGLGSSGLFVFAIPHGADPVAAFNGEVLSWFSSASGSAPTYSFNVAVPSANGPFDIAVGVGGNNSSPVFLGAIGNVAAGSSGNFILAESGYNVSGTYKINGKTMEELGLPTNNGGPGGVMALLGGLLRSTADPRNGVYQTSGLPDGSYQLVSQPNYLTRLNQAVTVSGAPATANLNLSVDPDQDNFAPYAYGLNPPQGSSLLTCSAVPFSVYLSDGVLGTGIGAYNVSLDGVPVGGTSFNAGTGLLTFSSPGALSNGPHQVIVNFNDQSSAVLVSALTWDFSVLCATPTPSATLTPSISPTPTRTPSPSPTVTQDVPAHGELVINEVSVAPGTVELKNRSGRRITGNFYILQGGGQVLVPVDLLPGGVQGPIPYTTGGLNEVALFADSNFADPNKLIDFVIWGTAPAPSGHEAEAITAGLWVANGYVDTTGHSGTDGVAFNGGSAQDPSDYCVFSGNSFGADNPLCPGITATNTQTPTATSTPSATATKTRTVTASPTRSSTPTGTFTPSATPSSTRTASPSATPSLTPSSSSTVTPNGSFTSSVTPSSTSTVTPTLSSTATRSASPTPSSTPSITPSGTATASVTPSVTPSVSPSATRTVTASVTPSSSSTSTATPSVSPSSTDSASPTATGTRTLTASSTPTLSSSPSGTSTVSNTATPSASPSSTPTFSATLTVTGTVTPSATRTVTATATPSATGTSSATPSASPSSTQTFSATLTATGTSTPSSTRTVTATVTPSATGTSSATPSASPTVTPTFSATLTVTGTVTPSATRTATASVTPTFSVTATATPSVTLSSTVTMTPTSSNTAVGTFTNTPTVTGTPTVTASYSVSPTLTESPSGTGTPSLTVTATLTATPSVSSTATASPTLTGTPTISVTPSISPTFSASPSITPTLTITLTLTNTDTPSFLKAPKEVPVMGPVPVPKGGDICASFPSQPSSSQFELYNLAGQKVCAASFGSESQQCVHTTTIVPGIYGMRIVVVLANGQTKESWQKIVISP